MGASFGLIMGASFASIYQKDNGFLLLGTQKYRLPRPHHFSFVKVVYCLAFCRHEGPLAQCAHLGFVELWVCVRIVSTRHLP
jgi:hypothetical protein